MKVKHYWASVLLLLAGLLATYTLVQYSNNRDLNRVSQSVAVDIELYGGYLTAETQRALTLLHTLASFFSVSEVDHATFDLVGADALANYKHLQSLFWIPKVLAEDREGYERIAQNIYPGYEFKIRDENGVLVTEQAQDYYYPIYYQNSRNSRAGLGLNLAEGLLGRELDRIRDQGPSTFSVDIKPIFGDPLYGEEDAKNYLMIMMPVYTGSPTNIEAYHRAFKGFLIGAIRIDSLIFDYLNFERYTQLEISVSDITSPERTVYIALNEPEKGGNLLEEYSARIETVIAGDRRWLIEGMPTDKYIGLVSTGQGSYIAFIGMMITLAISFYIYLLRVRAEHVEDEVKARTRELSFVNRKLEHLTRTDALTQLANRRYFDEYLEKEWLRGRRDKTVLSLIICDVDYFKKYNDSYGHIAGDKCLQQIAIALKSAFSRSVDLVARYGGEEFAVILPGSVVEDAGVMERAAKSIAELQIAHSQSTVSEYVTMSFGACVVKPNNDIEIVEFIKRADQALYRAKEEGRNCGRVVDLVDENKE
ncbi:diguanylate cyclase domain-containing protein [Dasania marina]|uniref:diguanylate cyclase domain-containing protein n=1 Tax=Dasania marina TaxID=471499 RepID=UPI0003715091|nr:diguanylate cyclase [Dasania marina]